jgi:hypothetical protein
VVGCCDCGNEPSGTIELPSAAEGMELFILGLSVLSQCRLGYGLDDWGFDSRQGQGFCLFATASRPAPGAYQPTIQWVRVFSVRG